VLQTVFLQWRARMLGFVVLCCAAQAQQPWSRELHGWTVDELRAYVIWAKATGQNLTMSPATEQVGVVCCSAGHLLQANMQAQTHLI
jgi:hypothetical protein